MGWRDYAREVQDSRHNWHDKHDRSENQADVPFVPIVPSPTSKAEARTILRDWHRHLSPLDPLSAPAGFDARRWAQLVDDARWLYQHFASQLLREGWSSSDVFGVLPSLPRGGVLLDRLHGARSLKLDGEGRAFWTAWGVTSSTCRGCSQGLQESGLTLLWGLTRGLN